MTKINLAKGEELPASPLPVRVAPFRLMSQAKKENEMSTIQIQCQQPGASTWGTIGHEVDDEANGNEEANKKLLSAMTKATAKLHQWRNCSADPEGAFRNWSFRLWNPSANRRKGAVVEPIGRMK